METIKECLVNFIDKPYDDILNFKLAYSYDIEKQYATAYSYYLRCAEYTDNHIFAAESLIRCSLCINKQKNRDEKELYLIKHAITASPCSIEPYYIASLYFSWRSGNAPEKRLWLDSYMYACMGINLLENNLETGSFKYDIGYSKVNIYYQKAYAGKNIGKIDEARDIYTRILTSFDISDSTRKFITLKKNELPEPLHDIIKYSNNKINSLKFNFEKCNKIENNYSQIYQDMFVLSMNNGKNSGTYLEIGAGDYKYGNNTYLLEYHFNWSGVSIDINISCVEGFNNVRKNKCLCADATKIDYIKLLNENYESTNIDYLQLDCDPPNITFDILTKIPFDKYKFGVITYEHDHYNDNTGKYREKSREFLKEKGYKLIAGNISSYKDRCPFEDWWIHPELVDENIYKLFERTDDEPINGEKYMLTKNEIIVPPKYEIKEEHGNIKDFYDFIPCHDQIGNDLYRIKNDNIENMLIEVYKNPDSIAVNTHGYVKNKVEKIKQIDNWWYPKDGIYIKKPKESEKDYSKLIPVFGTLVCTTTKWIKKQLDSIDYPIENFIIINNNPHLLTRELDIIVKKSHKFIKNLKVYHMPYNLGCSEGWNLIIKSFMFSPYWIICNDDVSFTPGLLEEMNIAAQDKEVGMIHQKEVNLRYLEKFGTYELFLIKDWVVEKYGFFDTNFYPAYFEDFDYMFRLIDEPIKIVNKLNKKLYHGDTDNYNISGQNTNKSDEKVNIRLTLAKYNNFKYFIKKWNCYPEDIDINKKYKYPFNKNEYSTYDFDLKSAKNNHLLDTLKNIPKTNISEKIPFSIKQFPNLIVIDDFYENPDEIREYALKLDYKNPENHGAVGYRSQSGRKILDGTKEIFEKLLYKSIPNGTNVGDWDYLTNGCFHWCNASVPIVYHSDSQQYAGIIYLTPDAPPNTGTSFFRHKKYKIRNSEIFSKSDWYESDLKYKEPHLDKTQWEIVDSIGNIYNRLVIFNAQQIHGVTEYFGEDINNSRLFQLFFFNLENSNKE
jgi:hypothetical protein